MTREEFGRLFESALDAAAAHAEASLNRKIPRHFRISLHGAGHIGERVMDVKGAADALYLGENRFYRIIDVSVVEVSGDMSTVFVRASAHQPGSFQETWNNPPGSGPFKQIWAQEIKVTNS
jgi:hypothetical protein